MRHLFDNCCVDATLKIARSISAYKLLKYIYIILGVKLMKRKYKRKFLKIVMHIHTWYSNMRR